MLPKKVKAILIVVSGWLMLSYTLSEYIFRAGSEDIVTFSGGRRIAGYFNYDLFYSLNLIALAVALIVVGILNVKRVGTR